MIAPTRLGRGLLVAVTISTLGAPSTAPANGGTLRLANVTAGPHLLSVWTQPDPPREGRLDVGVAVMQPPQNQAILDAVVQVRAEPIDGGARAAASPATRGAGGNLVLYHALLELPAAGRWRVTVMARSSLGAGHVTFDLTVERRSPLPWILGTLVVAAALAWLFRRLRTRPSAPVTSLGWFVVALPSATRGDHLVIWEEQGLGVPFFAVNFPGAWTVGAWSAACRGLPLAGLASA